MEGVLQMKVSIIVPAYNVENYIEDCLDSLVNQTLQDIEIIVINDGSTDNTLENILKYSTKDKRIKVLFQKNAGPSAARNKGLEAATGEYVAFVDADDWISPNYLENLYREITQNNCDIAVSSVIRKGKHKNKTKLNYKNVQVIQTLEEKVKICNLPKFCYVWGKLFKKEILKDKNFCEGVFFEDILWLPEVLKASDRLVTVPDTLYYYRINYNSIVKLLPSEKKQRDQYSAKSYIVKFFNSNNLFLSEKYKNITKRTFYISKFPILKIKERNFINTCYLFSFIPILKFKDFDNHYIFKFLFLRFAFWHKSNFNYIPAMSYGVNLNKRSPQLIVSLTSHPARINYVSVAINTILRQRLKPDRVILWLAEEEFKNKEADLPDNLLSLKDLGLEIKWCENLYSYKKTIPALRECPNDIIVTADDDLYYAEDWLESLYNAYLKNPENIYVRRAVKVEVRKGKIQDAFKRDMAHLKNCKAPLFANQLMGGSGCLFPPNSLHPDIFNIDKFTSLLPTHDDIYLWAMAVLNNTKIQVVGGYDEEMLCVEGTRTSALCKINNSSGSGIPPHEAFDRIANAYPQIIDKIKNDAIISV